MYDGYCYIEEKYAREIYPAYLIGKQMGIDVTEVKLDGTYLLIKIPTDSKNSIVIADELKRRIQSVIDWYDEKVIDSQLEL